MYTPRSTALRPVCIAAALGLAASLLAGCSGQNATSALPTASQQSASRAPFGQSRLGADAVAPDAYKFTTLDDDADLTFNQLLGINTKGVIAGYFGSGASGHPNKGYTLKKPYGQNNYTNENYPNSAQTQVTAINNTGYTAGFWVDGKGNNFGFVEWGGVFTSYADPADKSSCTFDQLLGLNDAGEAVGFYVDCAGNSHGFEIKQGTKKYVPISPPDATSSTAAAINATGDVAGFASNASGSTVGYLYKGKKFTEFSFPNATSTMATGINADDEIVGVYTDSSNAMHGFTLKNPLTKAKFTSIDDPNGVGTTTVNGLNDAGDLVGFYVDGTGNTDGFLAVP